MTPVLLPPFTGRMAKFLARAGGTGIDGQVLTADDALGERWRSPLGLRRFKAGRYYSPAGQLTVQAFGAGAMSAAPFIVGKRTTFDRIAIEITSGSANGKVRLGIYADDGHCYPGALLLDAGQVDAASAAIPEITISQELPVGLYWLAGVNQVSTPSLRGLQTGLTAMQAQVAPGYSTLVNTAAVCVRAANGTVTGALPGTFPTDAATSSGARVMLRAA